MECPEAVEQGRNFRLLAEDELPQLLDFLTGYLPESLKFQQTLLTYMRDRVWEFHFYVAHNWPDDAICLHFPGMTLSPNGLLYESVGVFCPNDQLDLLKLLREEDILIDWSKPLYINFVHYDIAEELTRLYEGTGTIERMVGDVCAYENPEEVEEPEDGDNPDIQVLPLKAEHAEGIHELYPANDMECHEIFLRLIKTLPAAGVFVKGDLAAWMIQSYYGAMFSMQTKPEHRRKGYGTKLAKYLTKRVAEKGYRPFVVIRPENEASHSLYRKLGFRKLFQTVRMIFMPSSWQESEEDESRIVQEGRLEEAVRQMGLEHRVINALRSDEAIVVGIDEEFLENEETIRDSCDVLDDATIIVEEADEKKSGEDQDLPEDDEFLETISEQPEERIDVVEVTNENENEVEEVIEETSPDIIEEASEAVENVSESVKDVSESTVEVEEVVDETSIVDNGLTTQAGDCD